MTKANNAIVSLVAYYTDVLAQIGADNEKLREGLSQLASRFQKLQDRYDALEKRGAQGILNGGTDG